MTTQNTARERRGLRALVVQERTAKITAESPQAPHRTVTTIANLDKYWGPDQSWRAALAAEDLEDSGDHAEPTSTVAPEPGRSTRKRWPKRGTSKAPDADSDPSSTNEVSAAQMKSSEHEEVASLENFEVPKPGRPIKASRSWVIRTALVVAPMVMVGGLFYSCGVTTGSERIASPPAITGDEAVAYHLSQFPAVQAGSFGVSYLTTCLTHPAEDDDDGQKARREALRRMTSAGVTDGCGWNGVGPATSPPVVVWTGDQGSVDGLAEGAAARLDFIATFADGDRVGYTLPIWASTVSGDSFRIIGEPAVVPVPTAPPAPEPEPPTPDPSLTKELPAQVLLPFLQAWAASDDVQLGLVLAENATDITRTGLAGVLTSPKIQTVTVYADGDPKTSYTNGDHVTAQVVVDWSAGQGTQRTSYELQLQRSADRWLISDLIGGQIDPAGGAARVEERTAPTTPSANSTAPSTPPPPTGPSPTPRPTQPNTTSPSATPAG